MNPKDPVIYGVYPGAPGSSLLAGKRNGNRFYSMEVKRNIGSSHILDGEKVSIRYPGQEKTCNKCHQVSSKCPGKALAKDCTSEKVLLSEFMELYWESISFKPETKDMNDVDDDPEEEEVSSKNKEESNPRTIIFDTSNINKYSGVVIKGIRKDSDQKELLQILQAAGLPSNFGIEDCQLIDRFEQTTIYIHDLKSETWLELVNNLHGKFEFGKKLSAYSLVEDTPTKSLKSDLNISNDSKEDVDPLNVQLPGSESKTKENNPAQPEENKEESNEDIDDPEQEESLNISPGILQNLVSRFWKNPKEVQSDDEYSEEDSYGDEKDPSDRFKRRHSSEKEEYQSVRPRKSKNLNKST